MPDRQSYAHAAVRAKGEERRARILEAARRLLTRNGWRSTSIAQISRDAGVSPAGLLHHFESKDQLLREVLNARDEYDTATTNFDADVIEQINLVVRRFHEAPDHLGTLAALHLENLDPQAPLHNRLVTRLRDTVELLAAGIRRGQDAGTYRSDVDPAVKAVEVAAFLNGMETLWLLDQSIPLEQTFKEYTESLARDLAQPTTDS